MACDSIPHRLLAQAARLGTAPAYAVRGVGSGASAWTSTSWRTYASEVQVAARALMALGVEPGHAVGILGFNRPEWAIVDVAAMMAGGVAAGIYASCSAQEVAYVAGHAEAGVVLVEDAEQWTKLRDHRASLPCLRHVVLMRGAPAIDDPMVLTWDAFCARATEVQQAALDARMAALAEDTVATLIYTSGTTGPPKAVMLTHDNLAWSATTLTVVAGGAQPGDCSLSYLPMAHVAEQAATIHLPITAGTTVYFAQSLDLVAANLKEVRPTVFFGVPRIWEKFHAALTARLTEVTGVKKHLVAWTRRVCTQVHALRFRGQPLPPMLMMQYRMVDRVVLGKLKLALGLDRCRICVTGAAPSAPHILAFFASIDLPVYEIYGQSEDTGPTTFNHPGRTRPGTVGTPFAGVEVGLADDGEIIVRGRNVFAGYLRDTAATAEVLRDGWLYSGDLGAFDADGFLTITGRKKEILITAGGKNIAPKNLEAAIVACPLVADVVVIGDRRHYLTALVTIDDAAAAAWLADRHEPPGPAHGSPAVRAEVQRAVDDLNASVARALQIKKFAILPRPFTQADGELTPTLKLKRDVIARQYAPVIDALYAE